MEPPLPRTARPLAGPGTAPRGAAGPASRPPRRSGSGTASGGGSRCRCRRGSAGPRPRPAPARRRRAAGGGGERRRCGAAAARGMVPAAGTVSAGRGAGGSVRPSLPAAALREHRGGGGEGGSRSAARPDRQNPRRGERGPDLGAGPDRTAPAAVRSRPRGRRRSGAAAGNGAPYPGREEAGTPLRVSGARGRAQPAGHVGQPGVSRYRRAGTERGSSRRDRASRSAGGSTGTRGPALPAGRRVRFHSARGPTCPAPASPGPADRCQPRVTCGRPLANPALGSAVVPAGARGSLRARPGDPALCTAPSSPRDVGTRAPGAGAPRRGRREVRSPGVGRVLG